MNTTRNPARSRPLSKNVKRLMKMAREDPLNPNVEKIERGFSTRDQAYCDMQGNIFVAAVDRGLNMSEFAPIFMNSQLAGVIDYSFSRAGGMEEDDLSTYLRMPILLKSPALIVDTVMWLNEIVTRTGPGESLNIAVVNALVEDDRDVVDVNSNDEQGSSGETETDLNALTDDYEYAYWLGYIYRCECHMHDESSRMVYGAFNEAFMRELYENLALDEDMAITECAMEICHRMDALLVGKMWK
ncbi:MAG: hypothetical protein IJJ45_09315 [Clostridia bacterium]|nr:hypothetical protein [Clostridia bacterium]